MEELLLKNKKNFWLAGCLLVAFVIWTALVKIVDVQAIGPEGSMVGFAALNGFFHNLTGVHMSVYDLTDLLSVLPLGIIGIFGLLGLIQWIKRKRLLKIDYSILVLGGFYIVVLAIFVFFEKFVINYRPILIEGVLEASYPSSTTMLVMCVMPTAMLQCRDRIAGKPVRLAVNFLMAAFTAFMVIGRLISGVHWLTDIIGGAILSAGLVMLYAAFVRLEKK